MAIISIPQVPVQEINALIEAAQEEDTLVFDAGLYMLDGAILVPSNRIIYAHNQVFQREHGYEGVMFNFIGEHAQMRGQTYTAPDWMAANASFDTHSHTTP